MQIKLQGLICLLNPKAPKHLGFCENRDSGFNLPHPEIFSCAGLQLCLGSLNPNFGLSLC